MFEPFTFFDKEESAIEYAQFKGYSRVYQFTVNGSVKFAALPELAVELVKDQINRRELSAKCPRCKGTSFNLRNADQVFKFTTRRNSSFVCRNCEYICSFDSQTNLHLADQIVNQKRKRAKNEIQKKTKAN